MQVTETEVLLLPGCKIKVIFAFNPLSAIYACTLRIEIFLSNYATGQAIYRTLDIFLLRSISYSVHPVKLLEDRSVYFHILFIQSLAQKITTNMLSSKCSENIFNRVKFRRG
jgi:hypothetical protein